MSLPDPTQSVTEQLRSSGRSRLNSPPVVTNEGACLVLRGHMPDSLGPRDVETRIEWVQTGFSIRTVGLAVDVDEFAFVIKNLEPVCEAVRHDERAPVGGIENLRTPGKKSGRTPPDVNHNIEDPAPNTGDELGFAEGIQLVVEATNGSTAHGHRVVHLGHYQAIERSTLPSGIEKPPELASGVARRRVLEGKGVRVGPSRIATGHHPPVLPRQTPPSYRQRLPGVPPKPVRPVRT